VFTIFNTLFRVKSNLKLQHFVTRFRKPFLDWSTNLIWSMLFIEGRLQTRKWTGPEGEKRTTIEVVANQMQDLGRAPKNRNGAKAAEPSKAAAPVDEGDNPFNALESKTVDQNTPF
jgi:single-stranded DNA-binding protein